MSTDGAGHAPVQRPAWSGLTLQIGDHTHILPLYEDERIHNTVQGQTCPCDPEHTKRFGERRNEPDMHLWKHKPIRSTGQ